MIPPESRPPPYNERVEYESDLEVGPPTRDFYTAKLLNLTENNLVEIYINSLEYENVCETCKEEKCWVPEKSVLADFVQEYGIETPYEHACCCECHDPECSGPSIEPHPDDLTFSDDEYIDWKDAGLLARSEGLDIDELYDSAAEHIPVLNQLSRTPSSNHRP